MNSLTLKDRIDAMVQKWTLVGLKTIWEKQLIPYEIEKFKVGTWFASPEEIRESYPTTKISRCKKTVAFADKSNTVGFNLDFIRKKNMKWMDKIVIPHEVAHLMQNVVIAFQYYDDPNVDNSKFKQNNRCHGKLWKNILKNMGVKYLKAKTKPEDAEFL